MKINFKKAVCLIVVLVMALSLAACATQSKPKEVMTFRGKTLDSDVLSYMLSTKEVFYLAYSNVYLPYVFSTNPQYQSLGSFDTFMYYVRNYPSLHEQLYSEFSTSFSTKVTGADGKQSTLGEMYFEAILPYVKKVFVIASLGEEYNLSLTDKDLLEDLSAQVESLVKQAGNRDFLDIYLYDKHGISLKTAEKYIKNYNIWAMLTAEAGGEDSLFWDTEYPYWNYLLYDNLYGQNGSRKIDENTVKTTFLEDYCIFDKVDYSVYSTVGEETYLRLEEFITQDIKDIFNENYKKVSYVSLSRKDKDGNDITSGSRETADEILQKLTDSEIEWGKIAESYSDTKSGTYCFAPGDSKVDDSIEEAVPNLNQGEFLVVTGTDNIFVLKGETVSENDLSSVKNEIITVISKNYFDDNYNKIDYIFISYHDETGNDYDEEMVAEIRALGDEITDKLKSGELNFDSESDRFVEKAYKDSDYTVKVNSTAYGKNELSDDLEEKVNKLSVGEYDGHEDEYGYYVLKRVEKEDEDFNDSSVQYTMTMDFLRQIADDFEQKVKNGEIAFEDAEKHSKYAKYSVAGYIDYNEYGEKLKEIYSLEELGDINTGIENYQVSVKHIRQTTNEDYDEYKNEVTEEFNYKDFTKFLEEAYKEIQINEEELNKFKSTFMAMNVINVPSLDTPEDNSN